MKKVAIITLLCSTLYSGNTFSAGGNVDKIYHITASTAISTLLRDRIQNDILTFSACMSVGLGKEFYDQYSYGGFDQYDLMADAVGCLIGVQPNVSLSRKGDANMINFRFNFK